MGLRLTVVAVLILLRVGVARGANTESMPSDFVDLHALDPSIVIDMRYAVGNNFVGHPIPGYSANRCLLTRPAAEALAAIQRQLREFGLSLKVYDCYRPRTAVDYFVRWAKDPSEAAMKREFYPRVPKSELFAKGYVASPSSHSRGSTVDATIVSSHGDANRAKPSCGLPDSSALDMGTGFDCFDERAHTHAEGLSAQQRANRMLIERLFVQAGFNPYPYEWWHFTLAKEPYPDTYFDFPDR